MRGMTLAARPAIVIPTAVTAWKARPVKHPLLMTPAELWLLRKSLGLTTRALAKAIGRSERHVARWEKSAKTRISRDTADALVDLVAYTDAAVDALVEANPDVITVYHDDEDFRAHEDTGGRVLSAEWYLMVAGRAPKRIPNSTLDFRGDT